MTSAFPSESFVCPRLTLLLSILHVRLIQKHHRFAFGERMSDPLTWVLGYAGKKSLDWLLSASAKENLHKRLRKWKLLPQLLDDPHTRRMIGDAKVQDAPTIVADHEEDARCSRSYRIFYPLECRSVQEIKH